MTKMFGMLSCKISYSLQNLTFLIFFLYFSASLDGERPIVVYHGGPGDIVAVQFVEREAVLVGK